MLLYGRTARSSIMVLAVFLGKLSGETLDVEYL